MSRWDEWKAQEPAQDFATRTVAAALRERGSRRRFASRRWAGLGAAAAVMVAGVAWGSWAHMRGVPAEAPAPTSTVAPPIEGQWHSLVGHPSQEEQQAIEKALGDPVVVKQPVPSRRVAPRLGRDAGAYRPIVPPCYCAPGDPLCSCVPSTAPVDDTKN